VKLKVLEDNSLSGGEFDFFSSPPKGLLRKIFSIVGVESTRIAAGRPLH